MDLKDEEKFFREMGEAIQPTMLSDKIINRALCLVHHCRTLQEEHRKMSKMLEPLREVKFDLAESNLELRKELRELRNLFCECFDITERKLDAILRERIDS